MLKNICVISLLALSLSVHSVQAASLPGIPEFIDEMVARHHFKRAELEKVFDRAQHLPVVIEAISRPATTKPWLEYRAAFVNPERIRLGLKFWNKYRQALQSAEQKYGVPQEIILAVIGVETVYGQDAGTFRTLDALTTLAFDYPRRAEFFRNELENYLLLAREQQLDLLAIRGSYAGALGIPQFMPSSYRNLAVDFNGNNRIDLLREAGDAIGSVANYLKSYGWDAGNQHTGDPLSNEGAAQLKHPVAVQVQVRENNGIGETAATRTLAAWSAAGVAPGEDIDQAETARLIDFTLAESKEFWLVFNNFEVIARYNNSDFYAMSVFQLAEALKAARKINPAKISPAKISPAK
ncbi:MAG: lytic murein transglycosylase B [Gallionella sp.]|nr:lytic murein transglycosylase B [Gallionella sp.]